MKKGKNSKNRKLLLLLLLTACNLACYSQSNEVKKDITILYLYADKLPTFPTGKKGLKSFIKNNIKWPNSDIDAHGSVLVSFIVVNTGVIKDIVVEKSLGYDFDNEAKRLVASMPNWNSGVLNGKKVNVKLYLPISFVLK